MCVRWSQVQLFLLQCAPGPYRGAVPTHPDALLARAYDLAKGRIPHRAVHVARFVPVDDLVYIVSSDGTTMVASSEHDARQLVPDRFEIIEGPTDPTDR